MLHGLYLERAELDVLRERVLTTPAAATLLVGAAARLKICERNQAGLSPIGGSAGATPTISLAFNLRREPYP
jgi:hypothetical protein